MNTEQKARAYNNLLKAIEDKRLAVVPRPSTDEMLDTCEPREDVDARKAIAWEIESAISAVDQQEILKELEG